MSDDRFREALGHDHPLVEVVEIWTSVVEDPWFQRHGHPIRWREKVDLPFRQGIRLVVSARRADDKEPLLPCLREAREKHDLDRREAARLRREFIRLSRLGWILPYWTRGRGGDGRERKEMKEHSTKKHVVGRDVPERKGIDDQAQSSGYIRVRPEHPPPPAHTTQYGPRVISPGPIAEEIRRSDVDTRNSGHGVDDVDRNDRSGLEKELHEESGGMEGGRKTAVDGSAEVQGVPVTVPHVTADR